MSPMTTYYNIIPAKQTDSYDIIIDDEKVNSVVIVLNTASGDAELLVYKYVQQGSQHKHDLIGLSLNDDYIPDVVRITKKNTNSTTLVGKYLVRIVTKTFSSYHLYYHTTFAPKEKIDYSDVMSELVAGQLIYDIFPADRDLQIYSYTPKSLTGDGEDIKITLKSVNLKFSFLVYLDLDKIEKEKVPADSPMKFKGFTWQGGYNNELVIKKTDPNYTKTGTYYILIQKEFKKSDVTTESIASFYLDVTTPSTPLQLVEGLEHSTRLDDDFAEQTYWYAHFNLDKSIELNVNIFVGMVNIYVNTTSFKSSDLQIPEAKSHLLKYAEFIRESTTFKIPPEALKKVCKSGEECEIFIMVQRASAVYDTDYSTGYMGIAENIAQLAEQLSEGALKSIEIEVKGNLASLDVSPLEVAILKGIC